MTATKDNTVVKRLPPKADAALCFFVPLSPRTLDPVLDAISPYSYRI
jgi:hypothetical protein